MPDLKMKRTKSGLLIPDHTPEAKPAAEPTKPKRKPSSVLKLNHNQRRRLAKPWRARKEIRNMARRQAAEDIKSGKGIPLHPRKNKEKRVRGCAEDCSCRSRDVPGGPPGGVAA